jgi:hypothetical protein
MTKRDWRLIIVSVVFGPLLGGLAFVIASAVIDRVFFPPAPTGQSFLINNWPIILTGAWVIGAFPALIFSVAMAFLSHRISGRRSRLAIAPVLGAVVSPAFIALVFTPSFFGAGAEWLFLFIALIGALSAFLCLAYIEWRHPLPAAAS